MSAPSVGDAAPPSHGRLVASIVLLAVALVAAPLFVVAAWVNTEITNTDRYVQAITPLADDPQVQQYVAGELAAAFTDNVDVASLLQQDLPAPLQAVSGTLANAVDSFVEAAANRFTASPAFKSLWVDANRAAHRTISRVLTGDLDLAQLQDGQLTINLGDAVRALQQRLVDDGFAIAGRIDLSGVDREVVLADGERVADIEQARNIVGLLHDLVWILGILALVTAVGSVVVAPAKAAALKRLGVGLALVVVVVAVAIAVTRRGFLSATGGTVPTPVIASFFDALVQSMRFALRLVFILGLLMAILVSIVNLPSYAARLARPTQIGVAVIGVGALIASDNPTWGYVLAIVAAVLATLVILEGARRRGLPGGSRGQPTLNPVT